MFTLVDLIDSYIELGYEYEDAYEMAMDDLKHGFKFDEEEIEPAYEEDTKVAQYERIVDLAMGRGYAYMEARNYMKLIRRHIDNGNSAKAAKLLKNLE